jgi:uncharacterized damage-inducible protein DinB
MIPETEPAGAAGALFLQRARYYLATEYRSKVRLAVEAIPSDRLWWRANEQSNSVGNLLLHLTGNIRQWIVSGVGGVPGSRNRAQEFAARSGPGAAELLANLDRALAEVDEVLAALTPGQLLERRAIQGRDLIVLEAVLHVVEHFSMHLGQIILVAKLHAPGAVSFYEDACGLARPVWPETAKAGAVEPKAGHGVPVRGRDGR